MQTQTSNTLHNDIMEAVAKTVHRCWKEKFVLDSEGNPTTATKKAFETYKSVTHEIRDQLNAEAEVVQIILTGIDNDIYSTVDACPNACEMWKAIERLKQGESINVQDLETNLFWEFGKFTSLDGESLESYYSRFYKMMNELTRNQCNVLNHQVNEFLLQLQPEWQRFVTLVKQSQELKNVSYHKLYDILKQHQHEVNEIRAEKIAPGSKDRPPMLAPGNYVQWKSKIKRYIDTKPNQELIHYCLTNPPYELGWKEKFVLDSKGNPTTTTERFFETYKNVKQDIRDQLNAEAEAVQIILT
nr:hypothetical protein [Tanacetum cinerariifolium]